VFLTQYDVIHKELEGLRAWLTAGSLVPAILVVGVVAICTFTAGHPALVLGATLPALWVAKMAFHHLWIAVFPTYRRWANRSSHITQEIAKLRARVAVIFDGYRERAKGEAFKKAYALAGRSVAQLEEALAVGMYRERREVFVTAFMRAGVAVRVTASIGSPYRCSAADSPARWGEHVERLGCDEIRQYHNHPVHHGTTEPSATDFRTSHRLRQLLGPHAPKLRSLIIFWNGLREWKIIEHDEGSRIWLSYEFDAAA
jgi:hypothetical protein